MTSPASYPDRSLISKSIEKLRSCSQVNIQASWKCWEADFSLTEVAQFDWSSCPVAQLNAKGHIAWSAGRKVLWLTQRLVIPQNLQGYPLNNLSLRLALTWWAEVAQIFVNGIEVQQGDLFDCSTRVLICPMVTPGEEFTVAVRLVSPNHDCGALVRSLCVYESNYDDDAHFDPGFVADELAVVQRYLETFEPEKLPTLAAAVAGIDWLALGDGTGRVTNRSGKSERRFPPYTRSGLSPDIGTFQDRDDENAEEEMGGFARSLFCLRQSLVKSQVVNHNFQIHLLGHAHLDLAWLWSVSETWEVAQRTFVSVLQLLQDFPDLIFCHSTPALYAWIEEHCPVLFSTIQDAVAAGRWEVVGGFWVEPELNLISGESIVRQLLYGQRYVLEKFGSLSTVAWLPDSFGFCATLPQFFKQGGIEYFVTQKLRWNDTTEFPYNVFLWRSLDGTELFSLMSAPIGEGIESLKMATYACDWETQTNLQDSLWLPGVGDHGGGPTRDMLEVAQRWQKSPLFPRLKFSTAQSYLQEISAQMLKGAEECHPCTPIWNDELYLEFHRGCYTTHADQKRWNRRCEQLLYQAELFANVATLSAGLAYPKADLESAWKQVLFNQFHDILPGSSIGQVYVEANQTWQEVEQVGTEILQQSLNAIASMISLPVPPQPDALPIIVFNSLNWRRSEVVTVSLPSSELCWTIYDLEAQQVPCQLTDEATLLFLAADIPSVGYRLFWLCSKKVPQAAPFPNHIIDIVPSDSSSEDQKDWILENELLRVIVDSKTGDLSSIFDKVHSKEIIDKAGGNQLQSFQDSGQYWDAWNIDPNYAQHPLPPTELKFIQWLEQGQVQTRLRVVRLIGQSEFCQDYILQASSSLLKIATTVNWLERQVLVKAAFALNIEADYATYEIPCGAIQRPTQPKTSAEQAKWEVPALQWADLGTNDYGVSLLNDCKYGYDCQLNQLRLTLLRSPNWPDPDADKGVHKFTYAIYPHNGNWQQAQTVRRGYELNLPLQVMLLSSIFSSTSGQLPPVSSLLDLSAKNLILMAFKQSEDEPQQLILRCYECDGEQAELSLQGDLNLNIAHSVDLLERPIKSPETLPCEQVSISPWKIATFKLISTM